MREDKPSRASSKETAEKEAANHAAAQPETPGPGAGKAAARNGEKAGEPEASSKPAHTTPPAHTQAAIHAAAEAVRKAEEEPSTSVLPAPGEVSVPTEKPVFSTEAPSTTSQYVVTVDNRTGFAIQIDSLDAKTGARKTLMGVSVSLPPAPPKPVAIASSAPGGLAAPLAAEVTTAAPDPALLEAYLRGVRDYLTAAVSFWR